jgi:hydrogenase expression/formation protein HypD
MLTARGAGADIRMVYSTLDALTIARDNPGRQWSSWASALKRRRPRLRLPSLPRAAGLTNFSVFCNHVLTPPAIAHVLSAHRSGSSCGSTGFWGRATFRR